MHTHITNIGPYNLTTKQKQNETWRYISTQWKNYPIEVSHYSIKICSNHWNWFRFLKKIVQFFFVDSIMVEFFYNMLFHLKWDGSNKKAEAMTVWGISIERTCILIRNSWEIDHYNKSTIWLQWKSENEHRFTEIRIINGKLERRLI